MNITGLPVLWLLFASRSAKMQIFFRFQFFALNKSEQKGHIFCFISLQKPPFSLFSKKITSFSLPVFPFFKRKNNNIFLFLFLLFLHVLGSFVSVSQRISMFHLDANSAKNPYPVPVPEFIYRSFSSLKQAESAHF